MNKTRIVALSIATLLTVSPNAIYAADNGKTDSTTVTSSANTNQTLAPLAVASTTPVSKTESIRPDTPIKVVLDSSEKTTDFDKGRFQVTINGEYVTNSTYDTATRTISIPHQTFERYSTYTVTVTTSQKFYGFSFKTGSAIGEATKLQISADQSKVRTTDGGKLNIFVTDDYGTPAQNAQVQISSNSEDLTASDVILTNGQGVSNLTDHKKEVVDLIVTAKDATYHDAINTQTAKTSIEFLAGHPAKATKLTDTVKAGSSSPIQFKVEDQYGNPVEDNENFTLGFQSENLPSLKANSVNGVVSFPFDAPNAVQSVNLALSASSNGYLYFPNPLQVVAAEATKATIALSKEQPLRSGDEVHIQGHLTDEYGNAVPSKEITVVGLGNVTTNDNGDYDFTFNVPADLSSISLQVDGNPISLITSSGETVSSLPVQIETETIITEDFEGDLNQAFNFNGDWLKAMSPNGTYAFTNPDIWDGQSASGQFTVNVPEGANDASLSFDYMVSSETSYDYLTIYIDGVRVIRQSGQTGWQNFSQSLTPGTHTISLYYSKDGSVSVGYDAGFIDNVRLYYR